MPFASLSEVPARLGAKHCRRPDKDNKEMPANLGFLAMAQQQFGKDDEAKATLARLREIMKQERWAKDAEAPGFLRVAEELIGAAG
jgi:hypothetical protein